MNPFEKIAEANRRKPSEREEKILGLHQKLSELVSAEGPALLTIGMTQEEANEAILLCLKSLQVQRDAWKRAAELGEVCLNGLGVPERSEHAARLALATARQTSAELREGNDARG